jgi:hypothetical protein
MQEYTMSEEVKSISNIKIDSISLTLVADNRSQKVKKRYQIGNCRFGSGEAMLIGIKFSVVRT